MKHKEQTQAKKERRTSGRELATVNIRIYASTRDAINLEADAQGKTMARTIDEKFNPDKYSALS